MNVEREKEIIHDVLNALTIAHGILNHALTNGLEESTGRLDKCSKSMDKSIELMKELRKIYQEKY